MFFPPTQVIDSKLHLNSIHCPGKRTHSHACIVDQIVKSFLSCENRTIVTTITVFRRKKECTHYSEVRVCVACATHCCRYSQQTGILIWCQPDPVAWWLPSLPSPPSWRRKQLALPSPCLCTPRSPGRLREINSSCLRVHACLTFEQDSTISTHMSGPVWESLCRGSMLWT